MGNGDDLKVGMRIGTGNMLEKLHLGNQMVLEYVNILMETDTKVNGGVEGELVMVHTLIKMEVNMLGNGRII